MTININPKITIVTVCLNAVNTIESAILSIIRQSYKNIEIIIIDGGSTDGTIDIIKKYLNKISIFISESDNGIYNAMNKGLNLATGDWIYYLNADDYLVNDDVIKNISIHLKSHEFIYGNIILNDGHKFWISGAELKKNEILIKSIHHQSVFIKTKIFKNINGFSEKYKIAGDYDLFLKVFLKKIPKKYINMEVAVMRVGGVSTRFFISGLIEKLQIIRDINIYFFYYALIYQLFYEYPRFSIRILLKKIKLLNFYRGIKYYYRNK